MLESDKLFAGSVPENYDRYMVPLIFAPYAADLAERAASLAPGSGAKPRVSFSRRTSPPS
jgi:hypothetical protein